MSNDYVSVVVIIDPKLKGPVSVPKHLNVRKCLVSMQNMECASLVTKPYWMLKFKVQSRPEAWRGGRPMEHGGCKRIDTKA